jgi:hypothetical protein
MSNLVTIFILADDNCQVNGGIGVDLNNDGCLAERGRGSVYIPNMGIVGPFGQFCMVKTKDSDQCNCQNEGWNFTPTGFCAKLDPSFGSYRFITVSLTGCRTDYAYSQQFAGALRTEQLLIIFYTQRKRTCYASLLLRSSNNVVSSRYSIAIRSG